MSLQQRGFTVNTLRKARELEDDKMSVILKQRTCRDDNWKALPDGHLSATFVVGPAGGKISDETAVALGLVDGWLPDSKEAKEIKKRENKEHKAPRADKTGRRKAATGSPLSKKKTKGEQLVDIIGGMIREVTDAGNQGGQGAADAVIVKLFTNDKLPDSRVLAARLEDNVSAAERDEAWLEFQIANPDMKFENEDATAKDVGSEDGKESEKGKSSDNDKKDAGDGGPDDII